MSIYKISRKRSKEIVENAMNAGWLLWIRTHSFGNRRKLAEEILREKFQDDADAINATQVLIDSDEVRKVTKPLHKASTEAAKYSTQWFHKGVYFVFERNIEKLEAILDGLKVEMLEAKKDLVKKYPDLIAKAKKKHPELFREEYYISQQELNTKFDLLWGWERIVPPMQEGAKITGKFKAVSKELVERENKKFVEMMKMNAEETIKNIRKSFMVIMKHLRDKLVNPDEKFQNSTVEKPMKFLEEFKNINIFGDKPLEKLNKDIKDILDGVDAQDLRDDDDYRKEMGEVLKDVVEVFEDLPTVKLERALEF